MPPRGNRLPGGITSPDGGNYEPKTAYLRRRIFFLSASYCSSVSTPESSSSFSLPKASARSSPEGPATASASRLGASRLPGPPFPISGILTQMGSQTTTNVILQSG